MIDFIKNVPANLWKGVTSPSWDNPWTWGAGFAALVVAGWLFF